MLQIATKSEIESRVNAVNLSLKRLAHLAGVDAMTAYRGAKRLSTVMALTEALEAEERRLALHLAALPHVRAVLAASSNTEAA